MYKTGDKIVPFQKTVPRYKSLSDCNKWKNAKSNNQDYLFMIDTEQIMKETVLILNIKPNADGGNYYYPWDVFPYREEWESHYYETNEQLEQKKFNKAVEWAEEHYRKSKRMVLVKYKDTEKNHYCDFTLEIYNFEIDKEIETKYVEKHFLKKNENGHYYTNDLGVLLELMEWVKQQEEIKTEEKAV